MQLRSADEGSTVFYEVSLCTQVVVGADDSVSNVVTNTLKTISSSQAMLSYIPNVSYISHLIILLLTPTFLLYFLPFLLHVLFLRFTSLKDDSNSKNDHPNDHPGDVDSEVLAQVVFRCEDD